MPGDPQSFAIQAANGNQDILTGLFDGLRNGLELGSVNPTLYRLYTESTESAPALGNVSVRKTEVNLWPLALVGLLVFLIWRRF